MASLIKDIKEYASENRFRQLLVCFSVGSFGAGGYHGFLAGQGQPMSESLESVLNFTPPILGAGLGGIEGCVEGKSVGATAAPELGVSDTTGKVLGTVTGGTAYGVGSGGYLWLQSWYGYAIGYVVGYFCK